MSLFDSIKERHSLTTVTIPHSVISIEDDTFSGCSGLTSIFIPDTVTEIGRHAFAGCTNLVSITIPASVTKIYGLAFESCTNLVVHLSKKSSLKDNSFWGCKQILRDFQ